MAKARTTSPRARAKGRDKTRTAAQRAADALKSNALFAGLKPAELSRLVAAVEHSTVRGGRLLFRQGERADAVYVVVSGRLRAYRETPQGEAILGEIGPGEVVGETALVTGDARTASVRAIRDCDLLVLRAQAFHRVVRQHPDVLIGVAGIIAQRAARPRVAARAPVRTIAIVASGAGSRVDLDRFSRSLGTALQHHGRVRIVDRVRIERALGTGCADDPDKAGGEGRLLSWLQSMEARHRFVLFQADPDLTDWTLRCLRQADLVLLVGRGGSDPDLGPVEEGALRGDAAVTRARTELTLVWSDAPHGTDEWLRRRQVSAHHHVRTPEDLGRLARRFAGRAVGLVLGGGGARGLAHLGVMRAIEEAGIPIDAVGGTSIGAIMGAAYAIGWDDETRVRNSVDAFVRTRLLVGPTLPMVSFSSSKKITHLLRHAEYFGEKRIEDLPLPFFCVSANLSTLETVVHERGPTWLAVRSSASLPGVLPPVFMNGDLLVDGGVVNDVPVRPMRARVEGTVIACDINPDVDLRVLEPMEPTLSGWHVLGRKLNPFSRSMDVPNAIEVIMRAKEIGGRRAQIEDLEADPADVFLRPPTGEIGALDFKAGRALIDLGYRYTAEQLAESAVVARLTKERS